MAPAGEIALRDLLRSGTTLLSAAGVEGARAESLRIWGGLSGASLGEVILDNQRLVPAAEADRFLAAVSRRAAGEPLSYVTGVAGFRRIDLVSDARALIPRPETETVVEEALAVQRTGLAADIGTGTGAIALSLKLEGAFDRVIGVDISPAALALARENGERNRLQIDWREGDLVGPIRATGEQVHLLVSNPPYLTDDEYGTLDRSVRDFEPKLALVSGGDGMRATARLLDEGRGVVAPGGWIVLEVDSRRAALAAEMAKQQQWTEVTVRDDLFGRARCLLARRGIAG